MTEKNYEEIMRKMATILEEAGVTARASSVKTNPELDTIAASIMAVADNLDAVGADVAASRLDEALAKLAAVGCMPGDFKDSVISDDKIAILKAATVTLIGIADRLDQLGVEATIDVDRALAALAAECLCPCSQCAAADTIEGHCRNTKTHCYML